MDLIPSVLSFILLCSGLLSSRSNLNTYEQHTDDVSFVSCGILIHMVSLLDLIEKKDKFNLCWGDIAEIQGTRFSSTK